MTIRAARKNTTMEAILSILFIVTGAYAACSDVKELPEPSWGEVIKSLLYSNI